MSKHYDYLRLREGIYYYRRRVPKALRDKPIFNGQETFLRSLEVRTLKEARLKAAILGYDDLFEKSRATPEVKNPKVVLTHQMLEQIGASRYEKNLETLQSSRLMEPEVVREELDEYAVRLSADLNSPSHSSNAREGLRHEMSQAHQIEAEWIANRLGIEPNATAIKQLSDLLLDVEIKTQMTRADFAMGHSLPTHKGIIASGTAKSPTRKESYWRFTDVAEAALEQNPTEASWEHKVRVASQMLDSYVSGKPIYQINEMHIRDFMDQIQFMPANMKQRFPGLSLSQAVAANRARPKPYNHISPNTARDGY